MPPLFVKDLDVILADPEVRVVVETIGRHAVCVPVCASLPGKRAQRLHSNKEMVATYGAELLALAREHGAAFLFEASVGGGTPIITPMHQCLAANHISRIEGIVNGTTNFMLTKMKRENMEFADALKIAQQLGYAETKDPGDDVDGRDACRKIAILASLACGHAVYPDNIPTRGIRAITVADIQPPNAWTVRSSSSPGTASCPGAAWPRGRADAHPARKPARRGGRCFQRRAHAGRHARRRCLLRQGRGQTAHRPARWSPM